MEKINQKGSAGLIAIIVVLIAGLAAASGFGYWAFNERQSYKNQTEGLIKEAVDSAKKEQRTALEKEFLQRSKSPYKVFRGSPTYGTVSFSYPRTWSGYVDQTSSGQPINGYFHPGVVPSIAQSGSSPTAIALRVELLNSEYDQVVSELKDAVTQGGLKASAFVPPKMKSVSNVQPGLYVEGQISQDFNGAMMVIKVRDKTLKVQTQSNKFLDDLQKTVLASLKFVP